MNLILKQALSMAGGISSRIAMKVLKSVLNSAWVSFWKTILEAIKEAEKSFNNGAIKKDWVITKVMDFITQKSGKKITKIRAWAIKKVVGNIVDTIINELNRSSGKSWVSVVADIEKKLNDKLKIIDPVDYEALEV